MSKDICIVVANRHLAREATEAFPDALIVRPGEPLMGHRFSKIICLWNPNNQASSSAAKAESAWVNEVLPSKLKPGGKIFRCV